MKQMINASNTNSETALVAPVNPKLRNSMYQTHMVLWCDEADKFLRLREVYESAAITATVIYVNNGSKARWLARKLAADDHSVVAVTELDDEAVRTIVLKEFEEERARVMVVSDPAFVLAKKSCTSETIHESKAQWATLVLNYDVPQNSDEYAARVKSADPVGLRYVLSFARPSVDCAAVAGIEERYSLQLKDLAEVEVDEHGQWPERIF